jgi:hypothetical protein
MKKLFWVLFLTCLLLPFSAKAEVYGIMTVVKGDVEVIAKDQKTIKARIGQKVFPGDAIIAKKDSRAKIEMLDKNIINISPDSKFVFQKYEYNPDQNKKGALLNVIYGKIRTTVNQKYDGEQNKFQVTTKTSVAGVRGTDFTVSFNETTNTSKVVTFSGTVEVGKSLDATGHIMGSVFVTPGHFTVASSHQAPTAPTPVPPQELATMKEQTLADSPSHKDGPEVPKDSREPSSNKDQKGGQNNNNNGVGPNGPGAPGTGSGSTLHEMGEDVSAPTANIAPPKIPTLPFNGTPTAGPCPNGQCLPPPVDPNLLHGKTNVIINLQPH